MQPPVFIIGSPRSGTTWLYHLLLSAGGFAIFHGEANLFHPQAPNFGGFRRRKDKEAFLDDWLPSKHFLRTGLDAARIRAQALDEVGSPGDFLRLMMEGIAKEQGADRWAECTPTNALFMPEIKRSFPDALFVHIVRDGRDVTLSLDRTHWIRPFPWDAGRPRIAAALYWEWIVQKGRKGARGAERRYLEIHYEDLVRKPRETLQKLGGFIGHELDFDRIQSSGIGSVRKPNTSYPSDLDEGEFKPYGRWQSGFSPPELRLIESLIGRSLTALGYDLGTRNHELSLNVFQRIDRALYRFRFELRNSGASRSPESLSASSQK